MAVKASRYLTHVRRLRDPAEPVRRLLDAAAGLGGRLGPVLLQLPPDLRADPALLAACLRQFPPAVRVAVEPRHPSWWTDEVREVLSAANTALCWADRGGSAVTPLWRTAGWGYLRFHEGDGDPWPSYSDAALSAWAERITGPATCMSTSTTTSTARRPGTRPGWPRPSRAAAGRQPGPGTLIPGRTREGEQRSREPKARVKSARRPPPASQRARRRLD